MKQIQEAKVRQMAKQLLDRIDDLEAYATKNNVTALYLQRIRSGIHQPPHWMLEELGIVRKLTRVAEVKYYIKQ